MVQDGIMTHVEIPQSAEIHRLMELAQNLAHHGRDLILSRKPPKVEVLSTKSTATDVVTQMDKDVELLIREHLAMQRPNDGFLGEEFDSIAPSNGSQLTWVVDPIDGTVNYLYGLNGYSVSVAVVAGTPDSEHWTQIAGCVVRVSDGATWWAGKGQGAWRDGQPIRCNEPQELAKSLVGTGFGYDAALRAQQAQVLTKVLPAVRDIRRIGSAAVDLCSIADGSLDIFYERGLSAWDMAAGTLIATEAGAAVLGLRGERPTKLMTIVGPQASAQALREILLDQDADGELGS